jgi:hypothetical protein
LTERQGEIRDKRLRFSRREDERRAALELRYKRS